MLNLHFCMQFIIMGFMRLSKILDLIIFDLMKTPIMEETKKFNYFILHALLQS